eukprot:7385047-Prymnesium_polylepis.1
MTRQGIRPHLDRARVRVLVARLVHLHLLRHVLPRDALALGRALALCGRPAARHLTRLACRRR